MHISNKSITKITFNLKSGIKEDIILSKQNMKMQMIMKKQITAGVQPMLEVQVVPVIMLDHILIKINKTQDQDMKMDRILIKDRLQVVHQVVHQAVLQVVLQVVLHREPHLQPAVDGYGLMLQESGNGQKPQTQFK